MRDKSTFISLLLITIFSSSFLTAEGQSLTQSSQSVSSKFLSVIVVIALVLLIYLLSTRKKRSTSVNLKSVKENTHIVQSINSNSMKETKNEIIAAIAIAIHHYENAHSVHEVERTGFRLDKGKISQSWSNKIFMLRKNPYRIK